MTTLHHTVGARALVFLRWLAAFCVLWLVVGQAAVHAQNVLLLHTNEPTYADAAGDFANIKLEFTTAGAAVTELGGLETSGTVTPATFTMVGGGRYDIVIMASAYVKVDISNWTAINAAIASRKANAFIMFNDGCCVAENLVNMIASITATGAFTPTPGTVLEAPILAELNTGSPHQASFAGLNPFSGGYVQYFNGVPSANALYLAPGSTTPATPDPINDVYALLVPVSQSYGGAGACLFATVDITPFESNAPPAYPTNKNKIGPAFLNAVKAGGSCGLPASLSKAFAPVSIAAGDVSTLTINVQNGNASPITGLQVTDNLPTPLVVAGAASSTCTGGILTAAMGSTSVSLTGSTVPAAGCAITVQVRWPTAQASLCTPQGTAVTNTIQPGTDFDTDLGHVNTPATAQLSCKSPPVVVKTTPVPTLSQWALVALTLLLGFLAWSQRSRRRHS